jgi:hypothetical protein
MLSSIYAAEITECNTNEIYDAITIRTFEKEETDSVSKGMPDLTDDIFRDDISENGKYDCFH